MPSSPATPIQRTPRPKAGDQVAALVETLRAQIVSGELRPGEPLRQELLADRFATSRMPVREALRVLESEGLVVLVPHKGAAVAPLDPAELEEVYEMRVAAETLALRRAIPELSNAQIDRAERIQDRAEAAGMQDFGALNKAFHTTLYVPCGRPRLLAHIAALGDVADRYLTFTAGSLDYRDRSHREHRALLAACRQRDEAAAVDLLTRHISEAGKTLLRYLRDQPAGDG
ncbi:GntR family transcriptional regulator [Thalassobaculum fulvum]|uniref:GntR family transcriptional regulator n=1 Tax=Thalassobaculum fulvum TaxID=1633335 RepID=UPI00167A4E0F|nr:GntR family transcriptional regulator [Thalassobaculum fulvum]